MNDLITECPFFVRQVENLWNEAASFSFKIRRLLILKQNSGAAPKNEIINITPVPCTDATNASRC